MFINFSAILFFMPQYEAYFINDFLNYISFEKRYSRHTTISYENDLKGFFDFIEVQYNAIKIEEITSSIVRSWLAQLKEEGLTSKSINRKISTLKSFFKYLLKINKAHINPVSVIQSLKVSKRLPSFIEEKDINEMFEKEKQPETLEDKTRHLLINIFYNTGIRLSELINIKEQHIDKANSGIKVLGKGNKNRIVPVSNKLLKEIDEYISEKRKVLEHTNEDYLLIKNNKKLYEKYVYKVVKESLAGANNDRSSPHILRHTFATHLSNNGADINAVKELLGHASLASTQVYTHNSIDKLKQVYKLAHPKS